MLCCLKPQELKNLYSMQEVNLKTVNFQRLNKKEYSTLIKTSKPEIIEQFCEKRFDRYITTVYRLSDDRILEDSQGIFSLFMNLKDYLLYINELQSLDPNNKKFSYINSIDDFIENRDSLIKRIETQFNISDFKISNLQLKPVFLQIQDHELLLALTIEIYLKSLENSRWEVWKFENGKLPVIISNGAIYSPLDVLITNVNQEEMWKLLANSIGE